MPTPETTAPLLHVSDPHFGTQRPGAVAALLALARQLQPQAVLLSGDITQRATAAQFAAADAFARALAPVPVLATPGNHDLPLWATPRRWWAPRAGYERHFGPAGDSLVLLQGFALLRLDTTRVWRHLHGTLSGQQLSRAEAWLPAVPATRVRLVMTHHPLVVNDGDAPHDAHALADRARQPAAAVARLAHAGAQVLLAGHTHKPFVAPWGNGVAGRALWVLQGGTSLSHRLRPGHDNVVAELHRVGPVHLTATALRVRWWRWGGQGAFQPTDWLALPLPAAPALG